jgi:CRP-like cAMP-binding protein
MPDPSFVDHSKLCLKEGDLVFRKGEMAEQMFLVLSGKVRLYVGDSPSGDWSEEIVKGDFFGEGSLLEALPRHTTAVAMEDTELIPISRGTFMRMIRQSPEVSVKMMQRLTHRNRELATRIGEDDTGTGAKAKEAKGPQISFVAVASGREYFVESHSALVGRYDSATGIHPDIDLTADDGYLSVSRRHARVFYEHGRHFLLEEMGVANGTFVHGERLEPGQIHEISDGDRIGFGAVVLVVRKDRRRLRQDSRLTILPFRPPWSAPEAPQKRLPRCRSRPA